MKIVKLLIPFLPGVIASAVVSFFLGYFGAVFISNPPSTPGDNAAWAGAIGTVGTLAGTIWLATAADRRRLREESSRAVIAAHALDLRIKSAWRIVREAIAILENESIQGFQYVKVADSIAKASLWTDEEVLPLLILPRNVAAELVGTRDVVVHSIDLLKSGNPSQSTSPARSPAIEQEALRYLRQADASLGLVASECQSYLRRTMRIEF